ncbi:MAG: membrane protein insertion efficiency factor YidD [Candidatus Omnitrophica bacterium]|nr:membrane protein insertion efficiency factor YidD [Candidatus Omnitrophota bacterium]
MLKRIALAGIWLYQRSLRLVFPTACRFTPSCSEYARQAFSKYGFCKGFLKAAKRLLSCHPFSGKAGYDPLT